MNNLKEILIVLKIYNDTFDKFLESKVKYLPCKWNEFGCGCFPIIKDNVLIDIRVLVPVIIDLKTLLVNIHEFAHAFELYGKLNMIYIEDVEKSEQFARAKEKEYLRLLKIDLDDELPNSLLSEDIVKKLKKKKSV